MSADQLVFLISGTAVGADVALIAHFGEQLWDDFQDRRTIRRHTKALDALTARTTPAADGGAR